MIQLSLRPYPGKVWVCKSKKEYRLKHIELFGIDDDLKNCFGRMAGHGKKIIYLVWAIDGPRLSHELSHVILHVFDLVGIDPRQANGEPFCYMLSQLLIECK